MHLHAHALINRTNNSRNINFWCAFGNANCFTNTLWSTQIWMNYDKIIHFPSRAWIGAGRHVVCADRGKQTLSGFSDRIMKMMVSRNNRRPLGALDGCGQMRFAFLIKTRSTIAVAYSCLFIHSCVWLIAVFLRGATLPPWSDPPLENCTRAIYIYGISAIFGIRDASRSSKSTETVRWSHETTFQHFNLIRAARIYFCVLRINTLIACSQSFCLLSAARIVNWNDKQGKLKISGFADETDAAISLITKLPNVTNSVRPPIQSCISLNKRMKHKSIWNRISENEKKKKNEKFK